MNTRSLLLVAFALCVPLGALAACNSSTVCDQCLTDGCGWCSATGTCLPGGPDAPTPPAKCMGSAWVYDKCPDCNKFSCRECVDWAADCKWCESNDGSSKCQKNTFVGCTKKEECDCSRFSECGDCLNDKDCKWCEDSNTCQQASSTATCFSTHTCNCEKLYAECGSCSADPNCVWCTNSTIPEKGNCKNDLGTAAASCPGALLPLNCDAFCTANAKECNGCTLIPGCGWCKDSNGVGQCRDTNFKTSCFMQHSCPISCAAGADCYSCLSLGGGCQWCEDGETGSCKSPSSGDSCDMWAHTCPTENVGECPSFSGGSFVGGMFTVIGILLLGAGGYFFYRWKMGQRVKYTELGG